MIVTVVVIIAISYTIYTVYFKLFGGDFNLVGWRFFIHPPNLNNANIHSFIAIICIAAIAFH